MRDPYEVLGVDRKSECGRNQERLPAARQEAAPGRQQERSEGGNALFRAERRVRDCRRRRQAQGLRPRRDRRRGQAEISGFRRLRRRRRPQPGAASAAAARISRPSISVPRASPARGAAGAGARGGGGFEDILRQACSAAPAAAAARASHFEAEDFGTRRRRPTPNATITLPEAAKGVTRRLRLPTGKDIDVKIPAGITTGQKMRAARARDARPGRLAAT